MLNGRTFLVAPNVLLIPQGKTLSELLLYATKVSEGSRSMHVLIQAATVPCILSRKTAQT